ncbi:MAG: tetratricopeptide repeat protein, partial [Proteobacteria bacterium]|nr:tetratricopeptide repeat protein [Pseudomonadota bacterium]
RLASVIAVALLLPSGAIGLYSYLGSPERPDVPFASRTFSQPAATAQSGRPGEMPDMAALTQRLVDRLKTDPNNLDGWLLLGRTHLQAQNLDGAVDAFLKARELAPTRSDIVAAYGELLVIRDQGQISEAARNAFADARKINPSEARALFYLGLDASQQGSYRDALQYWVDLRAISPTDAPFMAQLQAYIADAGKKSGIDVASITPRLKPIERVEAAPRPGPTREDVEAAQEMSPQDRQAMIQGMVQRLADRLKENPNDPVGWERLANAYRVLGEPEKSREAFEKAKALQGQTQGGAATPPPAVAPQRGPTRDDIDAARQMSPEDRQIMIRGMVERLADRLKENPNDRAGWLRLANAYRVLGETVKAREAMEKANALGGTPAK